LQLSCESGPDFVGSAHLGLKTCPRVCSSLRQAPHVEFASLGVCGSAAGALARLCCSFPLGARAGPRCTKSRCLLLIRDKRCPRGAKAPGQTTCELSPLPGAVVLPRCFASEHPPLVLRVRGGLWGRFGQR